MVVVTEATDLCSLVFVFMEHGLFFSSYLPADGQHGLTGFI